VRLGRLVKVPLFLVFGQRHVKTTWKAVRGGSVLGTGPPSRVPGGAMLKKALPNEKPIDLPRRLPALGDRPDDE
jgi:hypothetical protein